MAQYLTIARPYAAALFAASKTSLPALKAWERLLQLLATIVQETPLLQLVSDPKVSGEQLKSILHDTLCILAPEQALLLSTELKNFLNLIVENKRLNTLPDMLTTYRQLLAQQQKIMNVEISSAFELDESRLDELKQALSKRFDSEISVQFAVDKNLIGGAVIRTDKFVLDGSIRGRLTRLYNSLNS